MAKTRTLRERTQRAQEAWRALELSVTTAADKERVWRVWDGLVALDGAQAETHGRIEELIVEFYRPDSNNAELDRLLRALKVLVNQPATPRHPDDQQVFDDIGRALGEKKEPLTCLTERPQRPVKTATRTSRSSTSRKRTSA